MLLPPGSLILLLFLGLYWWRAPLLGKGLVFIASSTLLMLSLPIVSGKLMEGLESYPGLTNEQIELGNAQSIVVLGAGRDSDAPEYGADTVGALTLQRLRYAAWLQRRTGLPLYTSAGSPPREEMPLAHLMRDVLQDEFGVSVAGVEDQSQTTGENARLTAALLEPMGVSRIYLVSHAWHLPRAVEAFEQLGMIVTPAPTAFAHHDDDTLLVSDFYPGARAFRSSFFALHEYIGRIWYGLRRQYDL